MIAESLEKTRAGKSAHPAYAARMRIQAEKKELICQNNLKAGQYRKAIALTFAGGPMNIFVDFRIQPDQASPSISLNPQRLDLGSQPPGKILSKKIELTNKGREKLQWSVASHPEAQKAAPPAEPKQERYFSFRQEELPESGKYFIPEHLKDAMELIGKWTEKNGYPLSSGGAGSIKYRFQGTGISIFLQSHTPEGNCAVYLDEVPVNLPDEMSESGKRRKSHRGRPGRRPPHPSSGHQEGRSGVGRRESIRPGSQRGPKGWITVFPNSGTTLSEIDYLNVKVDTTSLTPGVYGDDILFQTNAGEEAAEVYVSIVPDAGHKVLDVYLYSSDHDYLYTSDPQAEARRLYQNRFVKEGIAFRLFAPQTPGTHRLSPLVQSRHQGPLLFP